MSEVKSPANPLLRYAKESETAFASLIFLLPFVLFYEWGTWYFTFDPVEHTEQRIVAFSMLRDSLAELGATARWVAPASVVSVLLGLAIFRRENFRIGVLTLPGMTVESAALAVPLMLLSMLVARLPMLANEPMGSAVVLSVGAGIYEELIFRLLGLTALHLVLVDFLDLRGSFASATAVLIGGVGFSLYHYWGPESFAAQTFVFRTAAGVYFGIVMLRRGFGVTVGCHAAYDLLVSALRSMPHG
jgi:hypothetical protein